jgi:hypothetical protein
VHSSTTPTVQHHSAQNATSVKDKNTASNEIVTDPITPVDPSHDALDEFLTGGDKTLPEFAALEEQAAVDSQDRLDEFIRLYFSIVDSPTDQQIHMLAKSLGMSKENFEARIYELYGDTISQDDTPTLD